MENRILTDKQLKNIGSFMALIQDENLNQISKWGVQSHTPFEWLTYTTEELGELANAISEYEYRDGYRKDIIKEAIQTATLCLKIAEMYSKLD